MRFGILGRLEVLGEGGELVEIGGAQPRTLLAMLLLGRNRVVGADTIVDAIWGDEPPSAPLASLQTYVSRLRRVLRPHDLLWESPGYRLAVQSDDVDAWRFERLVAEGRAALERGDPQAARSMLSDADALWRGPALYEISDLDVAVGTAARLEELRLVALEDRLDADLRLGRHEVAIGELAELIAAQPYRERLRVQQAVALYRSGRQAEALRSIRDARRTLAEELGIDPSPPLRAVEAAILEHDPSLTLPTAPVLNSTSAARTHAGGTLVGRETELDVLRSMLDDTAAGTRMVVVEGEPGIGKTRLAEELAGEARAAGALVVWGRCYEGGAAPAFWPWLGALRSLVADASPAASPDLERLLAPSADPELAPSNRFHLYEAVGRALATASDGRVLVIVLDDVQWADEASLELLGYLARTLESAPILVVVTVRELEIGHSGGVVDCLAAVARRGSSRRFRLRGLGDSAIATLIEATTGRSPSPAAAAVINERVDGNPFYAIELARLLDDGRAESADDLAAAVPAGVRDVIRQRVKQLPPATIELLEVAALIGRDVEAAVLMKATGDESANGVEALEPALVHRLLVDVADPPTTYRFTHALVREVLAEDVSSVRRARLHMRIAEAIESHGGGQDDDAEIIAEHLFAAAPVSPPARAADALERAAAVAIRRSAYAAAEDLLARAVRMRKADVTSADDLGAELDALASLFFVERVVHGHQAAVEGRTMRRARALAEQIGRTDVLARIAWAEWVGVDKARELERSAELAAELRALAATSDNALVQGLSLHAHGVCLWHAGDLRGAADALDRAAALNRTANTAGTVKIEQLTAPVRPNAWPQGYPVVPFVHMLVGDVVDPMAEYERMTPTAPQPFDTTVVWMFAGFGALAIGELDTAARYARRGIAADPDLAFSYWGSGSQLCLAAALVASGKVDEGLEILDRAMPHYLGTGTRIFVALIHARVAQGLARAGRFGEAADVLAKAYATSEGHGERWVEPVAMAVDAELHHLRGAPPEEVAERFHRARDLATEQHAHAVARHIALVANHVTSAPRST